MFLCTQVCGGDNSTCADCAGTPFGKAKADECNTCDEDDKNDCKTDCAGVWGGGNVKDACTVCGGDNSSCADCAGVPNGKATTDKCQTCDDDSSNDCGRDCAGTWGGNSTVDGCTICGGDNSTCGDCAKVPNGPNKLDRCMNCDESTANDCVQDCTGVW